MTTLRQVVQRCVFPVQSYYQLMSHLQSANREIRYHLLAHSQRAEGAQRTQYPIRVIDSLLGDLEELHLAGRIRVPESFDDRLHSLRAVLDPDLHADLRPRITIAHLMDRLYDIQDLLLLRKIGTRPEGGLPAEAERRLARAS